MKKLLFAVNILALNMLYVNGQINVNYWMNDANSKMIKKEYTEALSDFNQIIRFRPDLDVAYYYRANVKYSLGDYRGAIDDLNKAIALKPNYSYFYLSRGDAREKLFDYKGARNDYDEAVAINPMNQEAYLYRGVLFINQKKYDNALEDFSLVTSLNTSSFYGFLYRGISKECKNLFEDALADYNRAIQISPYNAEAYVRRGRNYTEMKDFVKALNDLDKAIKLDSVNSFAYYNRAIARTEVSDIKGALNDFSAVIRLDPENAVAYYNRADIKARVGDYSGAIEDYNHVVEINPNNVFTYFNRAVMWQHLGQNRKAIIDYTKAITLNPEFATAYYNRSIARRNVNDLQGSSKDYDLAVKLQESLKDPKRSSMLDSTGLAKLTAFKADFEEGNVKVKSNEAADIDPFPIISISYWPGDTVNQNTLSVNTKIQQLNKNFTRRGSFRMTFTYDSISQQLAENEIKSIDSTPENNNLVLPLFERAILKNKLQDYNGSLDDYAQLLKINPNFSAGYFNRANTRYNMINFLKSITENNNNFVTIGGSNTNLQQTQRKMVQNYDDVIADYLTCIKLEPDFYYSYYNLALVCITNRDFKAAISYFDQSIETEPKFAEAYYNRGLTYIYIQQKDEGCHDMSTAGELGIDKAYIVIKKYCND